MNDDALIAQIDTLVAEEHELFERSHGEGLSDAEEQKLRELEVRLDQLWDLMRQRRARRRAGEDPDAATLRDPDTVEHYQQ